MSTAITPADATVGREASERRPGDGLRGRALVIGYDASTGARAALRLAAALQRDRGARPHLAQALDVASWPVPGPVPQMMRIAGALLDGEVERQHAAALQRELTETDDAEAAAWPIDVETSTAASLLTRSAERVDAALIVMGLRRHGPLDRVAHDETTMHVMSSARCPVLGLAHRIESLPRRIVVGMDFTNASLHAARAALDVIARDGTLFLVYVRPAHIAIDDASEGEGLVHALGVSAAFERVRAKLANDMDVALEPMIVDARGGGGGAAGELRGVAENVSADLIAVGSRRHTRLDRLLLGSVTRTLVREGHTSLLVVPPETTAPPPSIAT
jgi:nucleotide-binding universal stress UspA family protein